MCIAALSLAEPGADTPFVGSTVCMCEHFLSREVQKNLALFAILRLLGFLSAFCNFSDDFQLRARLVQSRVERNRFSFSKHVKMASFRVLR